MQQRLLAAMHNDRVVHKLMDMKCEINHTSCTALFMGGRLILNGQSSNAKLAGGQPDGHHLANNSFVWHCIALGLAPL